MKIGITLINPPYPVGSHKHPPFTPLGLGYLASVLEKNRYEINVIDCQALDIDFSKYRMCTPKKLICS